MSATCFTKLEKHKEKKHIIIISSCPLYSGFKYGPISQSKQHSPCSNAPVKCVCGIFIWKYLLFHFKEQQEKDNNNKHTMDVYNKMNIKFDKNELQRLKEKKITQPTKKTTAKQLTAIMNVSKKVSKAKQKNARKFSSKKM